MAKPYRYDPHPIVVRVTSQMRALLYTELKPGQDLSDLIRKVLREHLDESEEIRGNRRAQRQVVQQETLRIRWYLVLLTTLVANIGSILITSLIKIPDSDKGLFTTNGLLANAEAEASQYGWRIFERLESAIEQGKQIQLNQSDRGKQ
jgi:hypothetical protein